MIVTEVFIYLFYSQLGVRGMVEAHFHESLWHKTFCNIAGQRGVKSQYLIPIILNIQVHHCICYNSEVFHVCSE
jgi:hypothetical protein